MKLFWYKAERNFGDELSPLIFARYVSKDVTWANRRKADILGLGSIIDAAILKKKEAKWFRRISSLRSWLQRRTSRTLSIWGAGFIRNHSGGERYRLVKDVRVYALRGKKSLEVLKSLGAVGNDDDIAFGDPGLLASELFPAKDDHSGKGKAFIPHIQMFKDGVVKEFTEKHPEFKIINPGRSPAEVIEDIQGCEEVYSCSLHGLIMSDLYGIPNAWVDWVNGTFSAEDNHFKYLDYYSAFGETREPLDLNNISTWKANPPIAKEKIELVQRALKLAAKRMLDNE